MNNEIKEILEEPKILMLSYGNYISLDDYIKLKDYITNLQTIEQQYSAILSENAELENKITNLEEKNERLLKQLEDVSLDEANIRADILLEQQDYKLIINKAIDYIKKHKETREHYEPYGTPMGNCNYATTHIFGYYELLNILQGEDNE